MVFLLREYANVEEKERCKHYRGTENLTLLSLEPTLGVPGPGEWRPLALGKAAPVWYHPLRCPVVGVLSLRPRMILGLKCGPKIHILKSQSPVPQKVTVFGNKVFK